MTNIRSSRRWIQLLMALTVPLLPVAGGVGYADTSPNARSTQTSLEVCQEVRDYMEFELGDPNNLVISNETKEPTKLLNLRPGVAILVVSELNGWIDTSPGQIFFPNGTWGPDGNGRPAPDDWLVRGASQFAVSVEGLGRPFVVGRKSACIPWAGGPVVVNTGLNVVQSGAASPLTNRWDGAIGVRFILFF